MNFRIGPLKYGLFYTAATLEDNQPVLWKCALFNEDDPAMTLWFFSRAAVNTPERLAEIGNMQYVAAEAPHDTDPVAIQQTAPLVLGSPDDVFHGGNAHVWKRWARWRQAAWHPPPHAHPEHPAWIWFKTHMGAEHNQD